MSEQLIQALDSKQAEALARSFLTEYLRGGFQSLAKREIDLLIFFELEKSGAVDPNASNHEVAQLLRVTPQKVASLRRDSSARWATREGRKLRLERRIKNYFTERNVKAVLRNSRKRDLADGLLPILIEHPGERADFEEAVKRLGGIPRYERNREVLLASLDDLHGVLNFYGLTSSPSRVYSKLKAAIAKDTDLKGLLTQDIRSLKREDVRAALNKLGASLIENSLKGASTKGIMALGRALLG